MRQREWTFLSIYGHLLVSLSRDPDARMRDVAEAVGITERAVQLIVAELVDQGYLRKVKVGRRNRYAVVGSTHLRHELETHVTVGDFLGLLVGRPQPQLVVPIDTDTVLELTRIKRAIGDQSRRHKRNGMR